MSKFITYAFRVCGVLLIVYGVFSALSSVLGLFVFPAIETDQQILGALRESGITLAATYWAMVLVVVGSVVDIVCGVLLLIGSAGGKRLAVLFVSTAFLAIWFLGMQLYDASQGTFNLSDFCFGLVVPVVVALGTASKWRESKRMQYSADRSVLHGDQ